MSDVRNTVDNLDQSTEPVGTGKSSSALLRWGALGVKLIISALLLYYVIRHFGHAQLLQNISQISTTAIIMVGAIQLIQFLIGSWRMRMLVRELGDILSWRFSLRLTFVGSFFSQTFVSFVGGDGMRIWQMIRNGFPIRVAGHAVLADRVLGFIMLLVVILLGLPFAIAMTNGNLRSILLLLSLASIAGCMAFFLIDRVPTRLRKFALIAQISEQAALCRRLIFSLPSVALVFGVPHLLNTLILYVLLTDYGGDVNFLTLCTLFPAVMLLSMLPVSFAGWGVREGALVIGLAGLGIDATTAISASIAFGLSLLVFSLPGCLLWMGSQAPRDAEQQQHGRG